MGAAMGCVATKDSGDEKQRKENQRIEKALRNDRKDREFLIKLLLLGAGESGKSTFAKQMKILFLEGYSKQELCFYKDIIHSNIIVGMRTIVQEAQKREFAIDESLTDNVELLLSEDLLLDPVIDASIEEAIKSLWADDNIKKTFGKRNEYQLSESVGYFLDNIDRIVTESYIPTVDDVLQARARTIGVKEISFKSEGHQWKLVDVGGQRNERKKWIHCFEDVTAIIFFTDAAAYNLTLFEDDRVNRLLEALTLFEEICNCKYFHSTPLILFLNKSDLLKKKIQTVDIADYFDDYDGGKDYEKATTWLNKKFTSLNKNPDKPIYVHVTCATDTSNIKFTFGAVEELILFETLTRNRLI